MRSRRSAFRRQDHLRPRTLSIAGDLLAIPVPGHTKGSTVYLYDGHALFTGDSLAWDFNAGDLVAWRDVCWYSWEEQTRSLEQLLDYPFDYVLAGHGGSQHRPAAEMHARLSALVDRMKGGEGAFRP